MSSGGKREKFNNGEKLISADLNRLQRFRTADNAEVMRWFVDQPDSFSFELGNAIAFDTIPDVIQATSLNDAEGLRADVFEGLEVIPQTGTPSLFVVPGVLGVHDPDGQAGSSNPLPPNPDDSPYKVICENVGIQQLGALTVTVNAGPGIRIDIVECQRLEIVEEQDNRDIFDRATGDFNPETVDKVEVDRLIFRIRLGVAGGGMPILEQGWLPLAVMSTPNGGGATTDDVTFWDVRPVIRDRALRPYRGAIGQYTVLEHSMLYADIFTAVGETRLNGVVNGSTVLNGWLAGGRLRKGTPTAVMGNGDVSWIDALNLENQEPGFAPTSQQIYYLWACFPKGLPRWVRYQEVNSLGSRLPFGPKGICIVSTIPPVSGFHNLPATAIVMPTSTGLVLSSIEAVCLAALPTDSAGLPSGAVIDGEFTRIRNAIAVLPTSTSVVQDLYNLVEGVDFPPNARSVRVSAVKTFSGIAAADVVYNFDVRLRHNGSTAILAVEPNTYHLTLDAGGNGTVEHSTVVSRIPPASGNPGPGIELQVDWAPISGVSGSSAEQLLVTGWKTAD